MAAQPSKCPAVVKHCFFAIHWTWPPWVGWLRPIQSVLLCWLLSHMHLILGAQEAAFKVNSHRCSNILQKKKSTNPSHISIGAQALGLGHFPEASISIPLGQCRLIRWLAEGSEMSPSNFHSENKGNLDLKGTGPWHHSLIKTQQKKISKHWKKFSVNHTFAQSYHLGCIYCSICVVFYSYSLKHYKYLLIMHHWSSMSWETLRFRGKILAFGVRQFWSYLLAVMLIYLCALR